MPRRNYLPPARGQRGYDLVQKALANRFASQRSDDSDQINFSYDPTNTTWPGNGWSHPRTSRAGYDSVTRTLRIQFFSNGAVYDYHEVPPDVAKAFRRTISPGRFINTTLNSYPYERVN